TGARHLIELREPDQFPSANCHTSGSKNWSSKTEVAAMLAGSWGHPHFPGARGLVALSVTESGWPCVRKALEEETRKSETFHRNSAGTNPAWQSRTSSQKRVLRGGGVTHPAKRRQPGQRSCD